MIDNQYQPDPPRHAIDRMLQVLSGPEPVFDSVMGDFLWESCQSLRRHCQTNGLLEFASLGRRNPWLYRLTFRVGGFVRNRAGEVSRTYRHVVALRFLPDYLRHADRFTMLRLIEPGPAIWHPNISNGGAICVEIYPGESLVEICHSLHDLFRWRLRQYDERDALNPAACVWGRRHVQEPVDDRPLFGDRLAIRWQTTDPSAGA